MTQTFQSGLKTYLSVKLEPGDTTMTLNTVPTVTKGVLFLNNGSQKEWISYTGVSGSTCTGCTRSLSQTAIPATGGTGLTWIAGTEVRLVAMHDQLDDRKETATIPGQKTFSEAINLTKGVGATVYASTAARDAALGGDGVATKAYTAIQAGGNFYNYNTVGDLWEIVSTGTATPNASTTAAGKVEIATAGEVTSGTDTGGTGAQLVTQPSQLKTTNDNLTTITDAIKLQVKDKVDVVVATTANITLSNTQTIDGVAVTAGQRVLVKDQTAGAENGIYLCVNGGAWTRATDFDANVNNEVDLGAAIWVQGGTLGSGSQWVLTTTGAITVGTTAIAFRKTYPFVDMGVKATCNAGTTCAFGAWTTIDFNTESKDTDTFHDNASNNSRITIPTGLGGVYQIAAWTGSGTAWIEGIRILKNGATLCDTYISQLTNSGTTSYTISLCETLVATDYIQVQLFNNSGGNQTSPTDTFFSAQRIA